MEHANNALITIKCLKIKKVAVKVYAIKIKNFYQMEPVKTVPCLKKLKMMEYPVDRTSATMYNK